MTLEERLAWEVDHLRRSMQIQEEKHTWVLRHLIALVVQQGGEATLPAALLAGAFAPGVRLRQEDTETGSRLWVERKP